MNDTTKNAEISEAAQTGGVVIITGLSGAGHTTALRALEDHGFEAVDNLPLRLLRTLIQQGPAGGTGRGLAICVDARTRDFSIETFLDTLAELKRDRSFAIELLFIDCDDEILRRRFTETRRRHPLAGDRPVPDGIARERELLAPLRDHAEIIIDTSHLEPRDFGRRVTDLFAAAPGERTLSVFVTSFSYRYGVPRDADLVIDLRFLRNPHYEEDLRDLTGLDASVGRYIEGDMDFTPIYADMVALFHRLLPRYAAEGKSYLTIALGCTGGRHRSVYIAEKLGQEVARWGFPVAVHHRALATRPPEDRIGSAPNDIEGDI